MALPQVKSAGLWINPANVLVRTASAWRRPKSLWMKLSGTWVKLWNSFELVVGTQFNQSIGGGMIRHSRTVSPSGEQAGNSYAYFLTSDSTDTCTLVGSTVRYVTGGVISPSAYVTVDCVVTGPDAGTYSISFEITG